jgi:hypothetical protein
MINFKCCDTNPKTHLNNFIKTIIEYKPNENNKESWDLISKLTKIPPSEKETSIPDSFPISDLKIFDIFQNDKNIILNNFDNESLLIITKMFVDFQSWYFVSQKKNKLDEIQKKCEEITKKEVLNEKEIEEQFPLFEQSSYKHYFTITIGANSVTPRTKIKKNKEEKNNNKNPPKTNQNVSNDQQEDGKTDIEEN